MPKMPKATKKYVVSFNGAFDTEYGDADLNSCDFEGDDVYGLAAEVIADEPNFPMTFVKNCNEQSPYIGWFMSVDSDPDDVYKVAVMMHTDHFYS